MPGVPTSKGCEACRRRKKGCDLGQPVCGRCLKLGIKCVNSGTGRLKFVDENDRLAQRHTITTTGRASSHGSSPASHTALSPAKVASASQIARLNKSAIVNHATGIFWLAYAPIEVPNTPFSQDGELSWLSAALQMSRQDRTLDDAISALALSRMSRATGDIRARKEALMFYGSCVRHIRKSILDPARLQDDSLLAAIMLLATFEMYEGTYRRDTAWGAHIGGASRLINARGPSALCTGFGRELYMGHLRDELIYGISTRGKSFRGVLQLMSIPELLGDDTPDLQLYRIMNQIPKIMQDSDGLRSSIDANAITLAWGNLLDTCRETLLALHEFSDSLALLSYPAALYTEMPSQLCASLPPDSPERIFPEYLHFSTLALGSLQLTTWTSILLLHSTLFLTFGHLHKYSPHLDLPPPAMPKHGGTFVPTLVLTIAKSLEFFILPENGLLGAQNVSFAIPIVMGYMAFWGWPQQVWFTVLFRRMRELNLGVEGFLADMFRGQELRLIRPLDDDENTYGSEMKEEAREEARERARDQRWGESVFVSVTHRYKSKEDEGV